MDVKAERKKKKYIEWRLGILERDGNLCRECGEGGEMHVHHIQLASVKPELFYEPSNVISLCCGCHLKKHALTDLAKNPSGRGCKKYLIIKVKLLSEMTGKCRETVRRHIKNGKVDPWDLRSICDWLDKYGKEEVSDEKQG